MLIGKVLDTILICDDLPPKSFIYGCLHICYQWSFVHMVSVEIENHCNSQKGVFHRI